MVALAALLLSLFCLLSPKVADGMPESQSSVSVAAVQSLRKAIAKELPDEISIELSNLYLDGAPEDGSRVTLFTNGSTLGLIRFQFVPTKGGGRTVAGNV